MSDSKYITFHKPAKWNGVLVIGERPHKDDYKKGIPFRSFYGVQLAETCRNAGLVFSQCATVYAYDSIPPGNDVKNAFVTKAVGSRNHGDYIEVSGNWISYEYWESIQRLDKVISELEPRMIIPLGEAALFAATLNRKIDAFRGSMLYWRSAFGNSDKSIKMVPTHSPARINAQFHLRYLATHDIRRAAEHLFNNDWPTVEERYILRPTYEQTLQTLDKLQSMADEGSHISCDIETRMHRYITCIGFAWSASDAICIPLILTGTRGFYWTVEEETEIVWRIKKLLESRSIRVSGQNYHYDAQYLAFHWGVRSHLWFDTLVCQHTFFSKEMSKDLNTISSLYNESHIYWKDEGKGHEVPEEGEYDYWKYNCKDCCRTWEAAEVMVTVVPAMEMEEPFKFQMKMWHHLLRTMLRGVDYDMENRHKQMREVAVRQRQLQLFIESLVPPSVWPRQKTTFYTSPKQLSTLLYTVLGIKPVTVRDPKTKHWKPTTNDNALSVLAKREPVIKPLCEAIQALRSLNVYYSTFLTPIPDPADGKMRTNYKLSHPSTYRLASTADVFDYGLNLQNLAKGND